MSNRVHLFDLELSYSRKLVFSRHTYKGLPYIDIEVYRRRYGNFKPTGNIVSIPIHKLEAISRILADLTKSMKADIDKHRPGGGNGQG